MPDIERAGLGATPAGPRTGLGTATAAVPAPPAAAGKSTVDPFDLVAVAGRDLLARVDRAIERVGAPPAHPVYPLLSRLGTQPCQAFDLFAGTPPATLAVLAGELRATAAAYRDGLASPLDSASSRLDWGGAGYEAFRHHWRNLMDHLAGEFPEGQSMVHRLESSASYAEALADWYDSGRRAFVEVLVEVLPTREAVTLRACTALADDSAAAGGAVPDNSAAVSAAAAEIAHRVLTAVAKVYDAGVDTFLPGPDSSPQATRWQEYLPELPYRPTPPTSAASHTTSELWIRL